MLPLAVIMIKERLRALVNGEGFWALADQGVVSLGTFITNILVARSLPPAEYGVYALIFGILLFLNNLHASLITYPLSIKGATADKTGLSCLATSSLILTAVLALILSLGVFGATWAVDKLQLAPLVVVALLLWQFQETLRRAFMAHLNHRKALWGDALSYLGQAGMVWILAQKGQISFEVVFGIIALTSGVAVVVQATQLGLKMAAWVEVWYLAKSFCGIGRWVLLTNLMNIFTIQAFPWALALFHGPEETAVFQALGNILGVSHPVIFSITGLIVPAVARARFKGGMRAAQRVALGYAAQGGVLLLPFYAGLALWPKGALRLFYGSGSPYLEFETVLHLFVLNYTFIYLGYVLGALLNGLEKTWLVFLAQLATAVTCVFLGLPLAASVGVMGALWGLVCSALVRVITSLFFLRRAK